MTYVVIGRTGIRKKKGIEISVPTNETICGYLRLPVYLANDVTLGDIFRLVGQYPSLVQFMRDYSWCHAIEQFHAAAADRLPSEADGSAVATVSVVDEEKTVLKVSLSANVDDHGHLSIEPDFAGVFGGQSCCVSLTPIDELANLPVTICRDITIGERNEFKGTVVPTLLQFLDAIYWDISFHGDPQARRDFLAGLDM